MLILQSSFFHSSPLVHNRLHIFFLIQFGYRLLRQKHIHYRLLEVSLGILLQVRIFHLAYFVSLLDFLDFGLLSGPKR